MQIFLVPNNPSYFVGREQDIKIITPILLKKHSILIYGQAGIGKTYLALKIIHKIKKSYPYDILWYRYDIKTIHNVLNDIARIYGQNITLIKDLQTKSNIVKSLLANHKTCLILDNIEDFKDIKYITPDKKHHYPLLMTSRIHYKTSSKIYKFQPSLFTKEEILALSIILIGISYTTNHIDKIFYGCNLLGNLPLGVHMFLRHIATSPTKITKYLSEIKSRHIDLKNYTYETGNLFSSLDVSCNDLDFKTKQLFFSLGVFEGVDFSLDAVAHINTISLQEAKKFIKCLEVLSLVEKSVKNRYRLHPLIKTYLDQKLTQNEYYYKLGYYYYKFLRHKGQGNSKQYNKIEEEYENIMGALIKNYHLKQWSIVISIWKYFGVFLWDFGHWFDVEKIGKLVCYASKKIHDKYSLGSCLLQELGWLYYWQGDITKSYEYVQKGLNIGTEIKNNYLIALGKQKIGLIEFHKKHLPQAEQNLIAALTLFKSLNNIKRTADTLLYLGHVYKQMNNLTKAKKYYKDSLNLSQNIEEHEGKAIALYYLGEVYILENKTNKAEEYFQKSLIIDQSRNRKPGIAWCNYGLALVRMKQNKIREAYKLFYTAKEIYEQLGIKPEAAIVDKEIAKIRKSLKTSL
jgi:tetratricopeptide (TPR) repeat protein